MQQLIYTSIASDGMQSSDVFKIIEVSARNNPARDVTGFLVFARDRFLQLVEGPHGSLDQLLADLGSDPRHDGLEILERRDVDGRSFPNWRMERLAVVGDNVSMLRDRLVEAGVGSRAVEKAIGIFVPSGVA